MIVSSFSWKQWQDEADAVAEGKRCGGWQRRKPTGSDAGRLVSAYISVFSLSIFVCCSSKGVACAEGGPGCGTRT